MLPQCVQLQTTSGLRVWEGILHPGDGMVVAVATGGKLLVQGPESTEEVLATQPLWVAI